MDELSGFAPAKVNLVLDILGRRPDGYHDLRTVLQTLELADRVTLRESTDPEITVSGHWARGVPADESNLAWRAMTTLARICHGDTPLMAIHVEKHIPAAAGLGGGASDAATVLRLLQRSWSGVFEEHLFEAANAIGSDEAFFLLGGTVLAEGRGEEVTRIADLPPRDVVLFTPMETLEAKTATLFRAFGSQPFDSGERTMIFLRNHPSLLSTRDLSNSFERVAFDVFPGLAELRRRTESRIGDEVRLAGAGPTLFWMGERGQGDAIATAARELKGCQVIATQTASSQWAP